MASAAKFRIDVTINNLLNHGSDPVQPPAPKGLTLPEPVFPQYPEKLADPGPEQPPEHRHWNREAIMRKVRGWLVPYVRSRVLPGEFHPIIAYFFSDYKCNLECWYCWAFDNQVKGMTEDVARRTIDWLHDTGCRVLAFMGGEPLLRSQFVHKVVYYAAKKGFWIYLATNGRLLYPEVADRLGDAGVACFNFALDAWDLKPGLPKALVPARKNLEYVLRKQFVYDFMVFFNINICRNNLEDVRQLTEYARQHRIATDYHLNETPMMEQDEHFRHFSENPTYIRPEDWREVDGLIDWIIAKNQAGYQMVNSVQRLREMKAFMRMASGVDLRRTGWNGDGTDAGRKLEKIVAAMDGVERSPDGELHFAAWNCRAGHNNVIVRTDGTVAPCFPMYGANYNWGNIDEPRFDPAQLAEMKQTCQRHCFSTLNHNLAYCYNDARVLKWLWKRVASGFRGGESRSFED
jgi:MoaA/NifB/PqqE/SkfB family radical SAM enzyme